jgi:triacylglycerol lipase
VARLTPAQVQGAFERYEADRKDFSWANAHAAGLAARAAYAPQDPATERRFRAMGFDRVTFLDRGTTQAVIASSARLVLVAFRGTEPTRWEDLRADGACCQTPALGGLVHRGFLAALDLVWPGVLAAVQAQGRAGAGRKPVVVTGHSLGGALAVLAAARLEAAQVLVTSVYTFGQPKVGDPAFAAAFPARDRLHRLVNRGDPVTLVPIRYQWKLLRALERTCPLRYRHVGLARELRRRPGGTWVPVVVDPDRPAPRLVRPGALAATARSLGEAFRGLGAFYTVGRHSLDLYLANVAAQLGPAAPRPEAGP